MAETAPLATTQALSATGQPPQSSALSIAVNVISVPDNLQILSRPITVTGTLIDMLMTGELALRSALGRIDLSLLTIKNTEIHALMDILAPSTGKSPLVDLSIQPGAPPKSAILTVPLSDKTSVKVNAGQDQTGLQATSAQPSANVLQQNNQNRTITGTVLPQETGAKETPYLDTKKSHEQLTSPLSPLKPSPDQATQAPASLTTKSQSALSLLASGDTTSKEGSVQTPQHTQSPASKDDSGVNTGERYRFRIEKQLPPDTDWPDTLPENHIKANVLGTTMSGHLLLKAVNRTIVIHEKIQIPSGAKLILANAAESLPDHTTSLDAHPTATTALQELISTLQHASPTGAHDFLLHKLPTPDHHFPATSLFLISALFTQKIEEWFGSQALSALQWGNAKKSKEKLIKALTDIIETTATDPKVGEWRCFPLPFHLAGACHVPHLYIHRDPAENQHKSGPRCQTSKTRFVISVSFSKLGPIQLDGLSQNKQLDLIIRSENPLPIHLEASITETAIKSLEAVGLNGSILFQKGKSGWVSIKDNRILPTTIVT